MFTSVTKDYRATSTRKAAVCAVLILLLLCAVAGPVRAELAVNAEQTPLVFGVFPRRDMQSTKKLFNPIAAYLSEKLGRPVLLKTTHDFNSFWDRMATQQYDLVHYNQYHYLRSHRDFGYQVILKNEEFKRSTIASTLVVRDDSGIHSVADLKGKKIVFGGNKMAMVSYIGTRYLLQQGGLQPNDYLTSFAINPIKAVVAVYYRQAAGAGTGDTGLELAKNLHQVDTSKLRVLAESEPLAHLPWAVKGSLDPQITNQLQSALSTLHESRRGRKILHNAALTRLVVATDDEYDAHRRIIAAVLGETY